MWKAGKFELCVIGSGPAGIILALEFAKKNPKKRVALIEFGKGRVGRNSLDDSIEISNPENHHSVYECTNKGFGGTSTTWGGRCVSYDEVDFVQRPILNGGCTWNLELHEEVKAFFPETAEYFECGKANFNLEELKEHSNASIAEGFKKGIVTDSWVERWSMPTRFAKRYSKTVKRNVNIILLEGWEARYFGPPDEKGMVSSLEMRNKEGQLQEIEADSFVLAAGGQETTRILLKNPSLFRNLESVPDSLGKYYQGHISGKIASVIFSGDSHKTDYGFIRDADGVYLRRRFSFDKDFIVEKNLLNMVLWLDNPLYHLPSHKSGAMSMMYLLMVTPGLGNKLAPAAIKHSITKGKVNGIGKHILNIIKDFPQSFLKPAGIFFKRYVIKRKLPGVFLYSKKNEYALHFHSEQIPSRENQMRLSKDGEKLEILYSINEKEIDSVVRLHEELDNWLRKCLCGKLKYWYPKKKFSSAIRRSSKDGLHQIGTTRIGSDPEVGVVDKNLRLFGTSNVFVCSSSVFPTSSQANPTFYLGAFAVRLANHLHHLGQDAKGENVPI